MTTSICYRFIVTFIIAVVITISITHYSSEISPSGLSSVSTGMFEMMNEFHRKLVTTPNHIPSRRTGVSGKSSSVTVAKKGKKTSNTQNDFHHTQQHKEQIRSAAFHAQVRYRSSSSSASDQENNLSSDGYLRQRKALKDQLPLSIQGGSVSTNRDALKYAEQMQVHRDCIKAKKQQVPIELKVTNDDYDYNAAISNTNNQNDNSNFSIKNSDNSTHSDVIKSIESIDSKIINFSNNDVDSNSKILNRLDDSAPNQDKQQLSVSNNAVEDYTIPSQDKESNQEIAHSQKIKMQMKNRIRDKSSKNMIQIVPIPEIHGD